MNQTVSTYSVNVEMIALLDLVASPGKVCDGARAMPWEKGGDREEEDGWKGGGRGRVWLISWWIEGSVYKVNDWKG